MTLGATALRAVTGKRVLGPLRGKVMTAENRRVLPTIHPAFLLRLRDEVDREREKEAFI